MIGLYPGGLRNRFFFFFLLHLILLPELQAQENFTLYHLHAIQQSNYVNPAARPMHRINLGIPLLGSLNTGLSNSGFRYSDAITKDLNDSLVLDLNGAINKAGDENFLNMNFNIEWVSFGMKIGKNGWLFLGAQEVFRYKMLYTKNLMNFLWNGNGPSIGEEQQLGIGLDFSHYREYSLGYNHKIFDKVIIGARFKYLYGMENINTARSSVKLYTDPSDYSLSAKTDILINTSGLSAGALNDLTFARYAFQKPNHGFATDFGLAVMPNDRLTISASVLDLGGINWTGMVQNYQTRDPEKTYEFNGVYISDVFNDTTPIEDAFMNTIDSIYSSFRIDTTANAYRTRLDPSLYVGATYALNDMFMPGVLFFSQFYNGVMVPAVTLSMNMTFFTRLNASVSYSVYNKYAGNVGVGLCFNSLGGSQFYMVSDNVLGAVFPQNAKNFNIRIGFNQRLGKDPYTDDEDDDGVLNYKDLCPKVPGPAEMQGCPDTDGDLIKDSEDQCPDKPGLLKFKGCPDSDGDELIDSFDECPDLPGIPRFKGCPDTDNDGTPDSKDKCPDQSGVIDLEGCPDKDGDGISDRDDKCPDQFGPKLTGGCPDDRDGDGVGDFDDRCPEEKGTKENSGCPEKDTDGDGVLDRLDRCPETKGIEAKDGCPEVFEEDLRMLNAAGQGVKFDQGLSTLQSSSYNHLDRIVSELLNRPDRSLKITIHVATGSSVSGDLALSKERAQALKDFITNKGIDSSRISMEYFGSARPIADNNTEEGRKANERILFEFVFR